MAKKTAAPVIQRVQFATPVHTYGFNFHNADGSPCQNVVDIEAKLFLRGGSEFWSNGKVNPQGKPKSYHFWRLVDLFWNYQGSACPVHRHPWALRMVEELCKHDRLSIAGCASSGKSRTVAAWGIVNFLAAPKDTRVMFTSTTLKDSRGRIWGDVEELWNALPGVAPGKLVSSQGMIRYCNPVTGEELEKPGLYLVAGEKSKESESLGKLIGFKRNRMILVADEMPELSDTLLKAAESNLESNPYFQMVGIGNPNSYYDPHGDFSEPEGGWNSISEADYSWQGKKAFVIRFNAEESPNFGPEGVKWPYLMTQEKLTKFRSNLGERSLRYYRMVKGFWFSESGSDCIYSGSMLQVGGAHSRAVFKGTPVKVAGLDPAFTHGGDECVLTIGEAGEDVNGLTVVERKKAIRLHEDLNDTSVPVNVQRARKAIEVLKQEGVEPRNLNVDATGGGEPWCDILAREWGTNEFHRVQFGGTADDKDQYYDRVSEMWFQGQPLVRSGQIRGIDNELAKELVAREYEQRGKRIKIVPKSEMKKRIGHSPDNADSFFLMLDRAIKRGRVKSAESSQRSDASKGRKKLKKLARLWDS